MIRLRVFDVSRGPKAAVAVQIASALRLSDAYETMRTALDLPWELSEVTLHAVRDRRVERAPLRIDFTVAELGLAENSIVVVRHIKPTSPTPPSAPSTRPVAAARDELESFLMPHGAPSPPIRQVAGARVEVVSPPVFSELKRDTPAASQNHATEAVLKDELERARAALRQSSHEQAELEEAVCRVKHDRERVQAQLHDVSRAARSQQVKAHAILQQRYAHYSSLLVPHRSSSCSAASEASPTLTDRLRRLHTQILSHALDACGNTCTTAAALVGAFFDDDNTLDNVYTAITVNYDLPLLSPDAALIRFVHRHIPALVPAVPLIQLLYEGHLAEFAEHAFCVVHDRFPRATTWLHCAIPSGAWHSAVCDLSQPKPPMWLLSDDECSQITHVQLSQPPAHSRCPRLGLENGRSVVMRRPSDSLAILFAAASAADGDRDSSAELGASVMAYLRENQKYLDLLCASDKDS